MIMDWTGNPPDPKSESTNFGAKMYIPAQGARERKVHGHTSTPPLLEILRCPKFVASGFSVHIDRFIYLLFSSSHYFLLLFLPRNALVSTAR